MTRSDILFLIVVATLPIQLGKFFFLDHSYVLGIPIDYRAITIYLSDFFIVLYILSFFAQKLKETLKIFSRKLAFIVTILAFNIFLILSTFLTSVERSASLWYSLKVIEFSLLAIFAAKTTSKVKIKIPFAFTLSLSSVWQSILIILQFLFQKSLGLWFLGERAFDAATPGIAHSQLFGQQFLRPYGTFPHPNVAAAFLAFSLIILIANWSRQKFSRLKIIILALIILAIALTFSKATLAVLLFGALISINFRKNVFSIVLLVAVASWGVYLLLVSGQVATIAERLLLIQSALDIANKNPFFGVGSNNFILELSRLDLTSLAETRLLQPVHNVFLLILSENGLIGLLIFALLMFSVIKSINSKLKFTLFMAILVYASIDHFLWTLHQGQLLFWLTLGYIASSQKNLRE